MQVHEIVLFGDTRDRVIPRNPFRVHEANILPWGPVQVERGFDREPNDAWRKRDLLGHDRLQRELRVVGEANLQVRLWMCPTGEEMPAVDQLLTQGFCRLQIYLA